MKKMLSLLLALAMIFALAACGGGSAAPASDAPAAEADTPAAADAAETADAPAEASAGGSVLRIGLDNEPSTMDPTQQADGQGSMFVSMSLFDGLWKMAASGDQIMMVAESYEVIDDDTASAEPGASREPMGKSLVVTLRDGLTFSNGDPITAEDVIWSYQFAASGTAGAMRLSNVAVNLAYAVDEHTVAFPLYAESPTLIEDLSLIYILDKVWCEASDDNINIHPVSSGAYELGSWESGMGITLVKRADYYDAANVAYDEVDITFIASEDTRLLAFENGDFDIAYLSNSFSIDEINAGAVDGASMSMIPVQSLTGFQMNTIDFDVFADQNVRQAIGCAIDVPTLVQAICGSAFTVADSILPSSNWAYVSCGNYPQDIEKARALLAEAGYDESNPLTFTCTISDQGYNYQLAVAAQDMLKQAGINMEVETKDGATLMSMILGNEIQFSINSYMGSYDPAGVVNSRRPGLPAHLSAYADGELEALLEEACSSMDGEDVRGPLWKELQERTYEYANFIPLYESNVYYAVSSAVDGSSLPGSSLADGYLFADYIKPAA